MLNEEVGLNDPFSSNLGNTPCNCVVFVKTIHMLVASSEIWERALALSLPTNCQPGIFSGFVDACPKEPVLSGREQDDKLLSGRLFLAFLLKIRVGNDYSTVRTF